LFYILLQFYKTKNNFYLLLSSVIVGVLVSIKISSIIFFPLPAILYLINSGKTLFKPNNLAIVLALGSIPILVFFTLCPFVLFDFGSFQSAMNYESSVALG